MKYKIGNIVIEIDKEDLTRVSKLTWQLCNGIITTTINSKTTTMGRFLLCLEDSKLHVDHIDRNFLNNQKSNLRAVTRSINNHNKRGRGKSRFKGVFISDKRKPWKSHICKDYKYYFLGNFATEEEAARAYDKKAKELYGELASLNFPEERNRSRSEQNPGAIE